MKQLASLVLFLFAVSLSAADGLPQLFQQGKDLFKKGDFKGSLATFDQMDQLARQPGMEGERAKIGPAISFYRAANLAQLGDRKAAQKEFENYIALAPTSKIEGSAYPKAVTQAFDDARKELAKKGALPVGESVIGRAYREFRTDKAYVADQNWGETAVRYLLTRDEKGQWGELKDDASRQAFVESFWKSRDHKPETPENEFRMEFERRLQFADASFATEKKRGSETDRGLVFVLLGAPTIAGVAQLSQQDDAIEALRGGGAAAGAYTADAASGRLGSNVQQGSREAWVYRKDRLPSQVKAQEVTFDFITREGYGSGVLQRNHNALTTLDLAAEQYRIVQ